MVGKVLAKILQMRLQVVADRMFPESQCGFRKGRGCTDMIFVARQLHEDALFILFADLKKAYDTVPRSALWDVLERYSIPPGLLRIIMYFHDGMVAAVRVGD